MAATPGNTLATAGETVVVTSPRVAALVVAAMAVLAGCAQQMPGQPQANEQARLAHIECARNTTDAVGAIKSYLASVDAFSAQQLNTVPLAAMRASCEPEFVNAYSDFLVRIRTEFTPSTVMGRIGHNQFINGLCRNDTQVGVKIDQLSAAAQQACRGT